MKKSNHPRWTNSSLAREMRPARFSLRHALATATTIMVGAAGSCQVAHAQDASYPYAPMNPYISIPPAEGHPPGSTGTSLPWPWNPLGTPATPQQNQTIPNSQVPTPTINPPSNFQTPTPIPRDGAVNPFGQSVAPGYAPEPSGDHLNPPAGTIPGAQGSQNTGLPGQPVGGEIKPEGEKKAEEGKEGKEGKEAKEGKEDKDKETAEKEAEKKKPLIEDKKTAKKGKDGKKDKDSEKAEGEDAESGDGKDKEAEKKPVISNAATTYDPIREALFQLNTKQYDSSLATLNRVLSANPNHPQAHYVRAIVYVMMRNYPDAAREYKEVLRLTPNSDLGRRAAEGLRKISL